MASKMAIMAKYGNFEYLVEYPIWMSIKRTLIDTHIGNSARYSKCPYLAIMAILEAISHLLIVRKSIFQDWILITYIEPHQNQLTPKWK